MALIENRPNALKSVAIAVGVALAALTVGSYVLGVDHLLGFSRMAMAIVMVVAFVKVWLVVYYFMDIRHAPRWLFLIVHGWLLLSGAVVVGLYVGL